MRLIFSMGQNTQVQGQSKCLYTGYLSGPLNETSFEHFLPEMMQHQDHPNHFALCTVDACAGPG